MTPSFLHDALKLSRAERSLGAGPVSSQGGRAVRTGGGSRAALPPAHAYRTAARGPPPSAVGLAADRSRLATGGWWWDQWWQQPTRDHRLSKEAIAAAIEIQRHYRGYIARCHFARNVHALAGKPTLARAREYKRECQPHTIVATGEDKRLVVPLPLNCHIDCFQVFGEGVYCYMLWMRMMKRTFFVAFLFAMPNMAHNIAGNRLPDCGANCWLSVHTVGNVSALNAAYGISELVILGVLLYAMFTSLHIVRSEAARMKSRGTPADYTVMLHGLPARPADERALAQAMAAFGTVQSLHVCLAIRDVLLRMPVRHKLLQALHPAILPDLSSELS